MKATPDMQEGEILVHHHIPNLRSFKRTALLMIVLTLPAVLAFAVVFADTFWPAVPLFVTCMLLMQERYTLGRHAAWITNRRIILQSGREIAMEKVEAVAASGNGVRLRYGAPGKGLKLMYPQDAAALVSAIQSAKQGQA